MPNVTIYNQEGTSVGELELSNAIFGVKTDAAFVHSIVIATQANARRTIASTKTRGEVSGGGKKPWKQKGTGRARQGSTRSPQWVGGGITFGPTSARNFSVKINKKAKRKALFMALSDKISDKQFLVLEDVRTEPAKTKQLALILKKLPIGKTTLLVAPKSNPTLLRMARNLPSLTLTTANSVGLMDVLGNRTIVFLKDAVPAFEKIYA